MKAVLLDGFGDVSVMKWKETPTPSPGAGQVLIKVMATSVNGPDIVQRRGQYPAPKGESDILGLEVAGIIEHTGSDVTGWKKGERVMALVGGGGYAEYAVACSRHLMPIPATMSYEEAACVCETYLTAFSNIFMIGGFEDSQRILIHGGGGGVNTAGIQLCRTLTPSAEIFVTASPAKIERVKALGAHHVINYREQNFADVIRDITDRRGVNLVLDHVGAEYLDANMKSLAVEGKLIVIGVISGIKAELNLALMMVKRQRIIGSVLRPRTLEQKADIIAAFSRRVLPRLADRTLVPLIYRTFPIEAVAEAHETMEQRRHFGKIVLRVE